MPAFDRLLDSDILSDAWKQVLTKFREGRLAQLMTLKPIEVYNATIPYDLDGAHLEVEFKAFVENILQKRFQNALSFLTLDFGQLGSDVLHYNCHVTVRVNMDYQNMGNYLNHQYANRTFHLLDNRIELTILNFKLGYADQLITAEIPLRIKANYKKLRHTGLITVLAKGKLKYQPALYKVSVVDISYSTLTKNILLKGTNLIYYSRIIQALEDFMQFNIKEELDNGLKLAKEKLTTFNEETPLVQGEMDTLELERIELLDEKASGVFLAEGKIKIIL